MLVRLVEKTNGPPTRISRWCCAEYKESSGGESIRVFGIRACESVRRKALWKTWTPRRESNAFILNPILYWTDSDVWTYIKTNSIPYCSLYDEGKTRLGCIGCPINTQDRSEDFKRLPNYERNWKTAISRFYDKWHGIPTNKLKWVDEWKHTHALPSEKKEERNGKMGFYTTRRWFDLRDTIQSCDDLWRWWRAEMPKEEEENDCQMGLF